MVDIMLCGDTKEYIEYVRKTSHKYYEKLLGKIKTHCVDENEFKKQKEMIDEYIKIATINNKSDHAPIKSEALSYIMKP